MSVDHGGGERLVRSSLRFQEAAQRFRQGLEGCEQLLLDAISQNPEQPAIQSVRSADELPKAAQQEFSRTALKCR